MCNAQWYSTIRPVWDLSQRSSHILGDSISSKKRDEETVFKSAISKIFTAGWHKMAIIYLWRLKGLWININDSAVTWPAAELSGF